MLKILRGNIDLFKAVVLEGTPNDDKEQVMSKFDWLEKNFTADRLLGARNCLQKIMELYHPADEQGRNFMQYMVQALEILAAACNKEDDERTLEWIENRNKET
jgi:hypothetical protein